MMTMKTITTRMLSVTSWTVSPPLALVPAGRHKLFLFLSSFALYRKTTRILSTSSFSLLPFCRLSSSSSSSVLLPSLASLVPSFSFSAGGREIRSRVWQKRGRSSLSYGRNNPAFLTYVRHVRGPRSPPFLPLSFREGRLHAAALIAYRHHQPPPAAPASRSFSARFAAAEIVRPFFTADAGTISRGSRSHITIGELYLVGQ